MAEDLIRQLIRESTLKRARKRLGQAPREEAIPALIAALNAAPNRRTFERAAYLLAELGGDEALAALAYHARTQRRYPHISVNALAACRHPGVVPILVELLRTGGRKQRRSAAFGLARTESALGIEPLCQEALREHSPVRGEALEALRRMAMTFSFLTMRVVPDVLARRVLQEKSLPPGDQARILRLLAQIPLTLRRFDPQRFLEREAANTRSPVREEAQAAAEMLRAHDTLLRPSAHRDDATLLRAAGGPPTEEEDRLLRAADTPEEDEEDEEEPDLPTHEGQGLVNRFRPCLAALAAWVRRLASGGWSAAVGQRRRGWKGIDG